MQIKVYNRNGKVKITKTVNHKELVMISDLADGEVAEIEVGVSQYTKGVKKKAGARKPVIPEAIMADGDAGI